MGLDAQGLAFREGMARLQEVLPEAERRERLKRDDHAWHGLELAFR